MVLIAGLLLILVLGLFWGYWYGGKRGDEDGPLSLATMLTVVTGIFAVAAFYGEEPKWAPLALMVVPLAVWSIGGIVLTVVDKKFFQGPVICSSFVEMGLLLVHTIDWAWVLEATVGSFVGFAVLAFALRAARSQRAASH